MTDNITPEQRAAIRDSRMAAAAEATLEWDGARGQWFWLWFIDENLPKGEKFKGAAVVRARSEAESLVVAHLLDINPGGQAVIVQLPEDAGSALAQGGWIGRLLSREEAAVAPQDALRRIEQWG